MTRSKSGSLTVFLALSMMGVITFCLVLTEGARFCFLRVQAAQAMELAEFSVLSEYQQELLENYGVFFLDLDYEQGSEQTALLEQRLGNYLSQNAEEIITAGLEAKDFQRATDNGGLPFVRQAAEYMKVKTGYKLLEEFAGISEDMGSAEVDLGGLLKEHTGAAESLLEQYVDEEGKPLFSIALPQISFPSVKALTEAVFGSESVLSERSVDLKERILYREVSVGNGEKEQIGLAEMQLFHAYLFEHFQYYGRQDLQVSQNVLEYQMEYIISGKESDRENLENIMWRIFLLRAGGNYLVYHQDAERMAKAEAEATALAGITGNGVIIALVKEILLISQAIEAGIGETKMIFAGEKVPLYENGVFAGVKMGYEQYLYFFLNTTNRTQKIYRSMDIVEMEVRERSGYESLRLDHCTDSFVVEWIWQADSIFENFPFLEGGVYENTIRRKVFYEM